MTEGTISSSVLTTSEVVLGWVTDRELQYCTKVMQVKFDELRSLFSRNFVRTFAPFFAQCRAKLRAKVHPRNENSWKHHAIFRKIKRKIALAKICGNKKELQRYTAVKT